MSYSLRCTVRVTVFLMRPLEDIVFDCVGGQDGERWLVGKRCTSLMSSVAYENTKLQQ
jgi:hypothetical protein